MAAKPFKDVEHLVRIAVVLLVGVLAFLGVRAFFALKSFGQYGHYRDAVIEIAALPVVHAGHDACELCHSESARDRLRSMTRVLAGGRLALRVSHTSCLNESSSGF